jgi:Ca2+-binding RTX toxin-like protein
VKRSYRPLILCGLLALALAVFVPAASAVNVPEAGDAGDLPGTAQITLGVGPLTSITGTIASSTDADMYLIFVSNPGTFSATTVGTPGTLTDTQLFLFDSSGHGVIANDDCPGDGLRSCLPGGPGVTGLYYLAISSFDRDPVSAFGQIFPDSPFTGIFGPSGPGGCCSISGWNSSGGTGTYQINITGASLISNAIMGSPGPDVLQGTPGQDLILGGGGNDIIFGLSGDDIIFGGPGNDVLYGGLGNDTLAGDQDNDIMFGGPGNDNLIPGADGPGETPSANDNLYGESGFDFLSGGVGIDVCNGGTEFDTADGSCESTPGVP